MIHPFQMEKFISPLLQAPKIYHYGIYQKENEILEYFEANAQSIFDEVKHTSTFKVCTFEEFSSQFKTTLTDICDRLFLTALTKALTAQMDYQFLPQAVNPSTDYEIILNQISIYFQTLLKDRALRPFIDPLFYGANKRTAFKYLSFFLETKNEAIAAMIQQDPFLSNIQDVKNHSALIWLFQLISIHANLFRSYQKNNYEPFYLTEVQVEIETEQVRPFFESLPTTLIESAVSIHLKHTEHQEVSFSSAFSKIISDLSLSSFEFSTDCKNKFTAPFEWSWLSAQLENVSFFGYNQILLREMVQAAQFNHW